MTLIISCVVAFKMLSDRERMEKIGLLMQELTEIRQEIGRYREVRGQCSKGLERIDPFGNEYLCDAKSGWVSSQTPPFEKW